MEYLRPGILQVLWAQVLLLLTLIMTWGVGRTCVDHLPGTIAISRPEKNILGIGLGLIVLITCIWLVGIFKGLYVQSVLALMFVMSAITFQRIKKLRLDWGECLKTCITELFTPQALLLLGVILLSWFVAIAPPIGTDSLSYHLTHPKIFINEHQISHILHSRESLWPYFTELLFTYGLLIQGTTLAKLLHWVFYPLCGLSIYYVGIRVYSKQIAYWAMLFFLFTPVCFAQSGYAYVDLSLAFFYFWAFMLLVLNEAAISKSSIFLAGLMLGGALAVKYLALGHLAILSVLALAIFRFNWFHLALFWFGALLTGGYWYIRSWLVIGNPVYPFFETVFKGHGYPSDLAAEGFGTGLTSFLGWLGNMTFLPKAFGGEQLGPWLLMFLPISLFCIDYKHRRFKIFAVLFTVMSMFCLFHQSQQIRFFMALIPILCLFAAKGLVICLRQSNLLSTLTKIIIGIILIIHSGIYVYRSKDAISLFLHQESTYEYLASKDRSFKGYAYLNKNAKPGDKIFNSAIAESFYDTNHEVILDNYLNRLERFRQFSNTDAYLHHAKFDYIWILKNSKSDIEAFLQESAYQKVYAYTFNESPATYDFEIYRRTT